MRPKVGCTLRPLSCNSDQQLQGASSSFPRAVAASSGGHDDLREVHPETRSGCRVGCWDRHPQSISRGSLEGRKRRPAVVSYHPHSLHSPALFISHLPTVRRGHPPRRGIRVPDLLVHDELAYLRVQVHAHLDDGLAAAIGTSSGKRRTLHRQLEGCLRVPATLGNLLARSGGQAGKMGDCTLVTHPQARVLCTLKLALCKYPALFSSLGVGRQVPTSKRRLCQAVAKCLFNTKCLPALRCCPTTP